MGRYVVDMAKETCPNCNARLPRAASFCPTCERPTRYATPEELKEHDVRTWRAHRERSASGDWHNGSAVALYEPGTVEGYQPSAAPAPAIRIEHPLADEPAPRHRVLRSAKTESVRAAKPAEPTAAKTRRRIRLPKASFPKAETGDRVINLDTDNPFAYSSCTECARTDWIVRTKHNEDGTWMYWCVRCSRSFKSDVRIENAAKPFMAAGSVIGFIVAASQLILR